MTAKCIDCKLPWNISIKAEIPKEGYKCPKCEAKEKERKKNITKPKKRIKSEGRISSVLLRNRSKLSISNS